MIGISKLSRGTSRNSEGAQNSHSRDFDKKRKSDQLAQYFIIDVFLSIKLRKQKNDFKEQKWVLNLVNYEKRFLLLRALI